MSSLLLKALDELPISVLIATSNGILVEMNKTAIHTFKKQLMIHDDLTLKLGALEGEGKQNILIHNEGNFELGKSIYRFTSSKLTDDEGNKYLNICVFDDTISFQRLKNAEVIAKHAENAAARYCSRAESQNALQDDMNEFEVKVSLVSDTLPLLKVLCFKLITQHNVMSVGCWIWVFSRPECYYAKVESDWGNCGVQ